MDSIAALGFSIDSSQALTGVQNLDRLTAAAGKTATAAEQVTRATTAEAQAMGRAAQAHAQAAQAAATHASAQGRLDQAVRTSGGGFQNVAFQVQDFAVQVGGGTSAITALSQQLPQLLGGFGLLGAGIGAAVAVTGGLITYFINLKSESEAVADLLEGRLSAGFDSAASMARKYADQLINASAETRRFLQETAKLQGDALNTSIGEDVGKLISGSDVGLPQGPIGLLSPPGQAGAAAGAAVAQARTGAREKLIAAVKSGDPDQVSAVAREFGIGGTAESNKLIADLRSRAGEYAANQALQAGSVPRLEGIAGTGVNGRPEGQSASSVAAGRSKEVDALFKQFEQEAKAAEQIRLLRERIGAVGNDRQQAVNAARNSAPEGATTAQIQALEQEAGRLYDVEKAHNDAAAAAKKRASEAETAAKRTAAEQERDLDKLKEIEGRLANVGDKRAQYIAQGLKGFSDNVSPEQRERAGAVLGEVFDREQFEKNEEIIRKLGAGAVAYKNERDEFVAKAVESLDEFATPDQISRIRDQAAATYDLKKATEEYAQAAKDAEQTNGEYASAAEKLADRLAALEKQNKTGKLSPGAKARAEQEATGPGFRQDLIAELGASNNVVDGMKLGLVELAQEIDNVAVTTSTVLVGAFNVASDALGDFIATGKADYKGMLQDFAEETARYLARQALLRAVVGAASAAFGGGYAGAYHTGGVVGQTAVPTRQIDPMYFASAPRFHAGGMFAADERPAVLLTGERVLNRRETAEYSRGRGGTKTLTISMPINVSNADEEIIATRIQRDMAQVAPRLVNASVAKGNDERRRNPNARGR